MISNIGNKTRFVNINRKITCKFLLKCKVHVSFITFILEDEYRLSLGMLMHGKCIHELCISLLSKKKILFLSLPYVVRFVQLHPPSRVSVSSMYFAPLPSKPCHNSSVIEAFFLSTAILDPHPASIDLPPGIAPSRPRTEAPRVLLLSPIRPAARCRWRPATTPGDLLWKCSGCPLPPEPRTSPAGAPPSVAPNQCRRG